MGHSLQVSLSLIHDHFDNLNNQMVLHVQLLRYLDYQGALEHIADFLGSVS